MTIPDVRYVPLPSKGRTFAHRRRVRLDEVGPDARLRVDAVARYLQDVASDDWADSGLSNDLTWVVRRTAMCLVEGGRWPTLGEDVTVTTWCGGYGAAWAERRSSISIDGRPQVETVALWVPIDPSGRPQRIRDEFRNMYGEACDNRKVSGRVELVEPPAEAVRRPWSLRKSDLDIVDHVNNAAQWSAVVEVAGSSIGEAVLTHHGPIEEGDDVTLVEDGSNVWLVVEGDVRVAASFRST
jgi:acyl-ACP thioesterase